MPKLNPICIELSWLSSVELGLGVDNKFVVRGSVVCVIYTKGLKLNFLKGHLYSIMIYSKSLRY